MTDYCTGQLRGQAGKGVDCDSLSRLSVRLLARTADVPCIAIVSTRHYMYSCTVHTVQLHTAVLCIHPADTHTPAHATASYSAPTPLYARCVDEYRSTWTLDTYRSSRSTVSTTPRARINTTRRAQLFGRLSELTPVTTTPSAEECKLPRGVRSDAAAAGSCGCWASLLCSLLRDAPPPVE